MGVIKVSMYLAQNTNWGNFSDRIGIQLGVLVFEDRGEGKTGESGENSLGARTRTNNKINPHMTRSPGVKREAKAHTHSSLNTFCRGYKELKLNPLRSIYENQHF